MKMTDCIIAHKLLTIPPLFIHRSLTTKVYYSCVVFYDVEGELWFVSTWTLLFHVFVSK